MGPSIVRLPDFDRSNECIYQLNWLGKVRRNGQRFEIFTRFVPETPHGSLREPFDCWVRLTDLPFLIPGSRWYRGVMVGKPQNLRTIRLRDTRIIKIHSLSRTPKQGAMCFGPAYALAFDTPASPVAEFECNDGLRVLVPITEIYRSHYFGIPRALAGLLHGLHRGGLDNPSFEAWDPALTAWTNKRSGIARIAPAKFLQTNQVAYVARLLFSEASLRTLDKLHDWVLKYFTQSENAHEPIPPKLLPIPQLPYPKAVWEASTVDLEVGDCKRPCQLVTYIQSFDAPEPYSELELLDPMPSISAESDQSDSGGRGHGEVLSPMERDSIDNVEEGWDPGLEPVSVADVITVDLAARRRMPTRVQREPLPVAKGSTRRLPQEVATLATSTQVYGPHGSRVAPLLFSDEDYWPERDASMDVAFKAIQRAVDEAVDKHVRSGISAEAKFLPDVNRAYAFEIAQSGRSRKHSSVRQFVVAHVRLGSKHALVIEPQRRSGVESIPLGIVWRVGEHAYSPIELDGIRDIVRHLEDAVLNGKSWARLDGLSEIFNASPIWHPATKSANCSAVQHFSERIRTRLLSVIGDARTLADS